MATRMALSRSRALAQGSCFASRSRSSFGYSTGRSSSLPALGGGPSYSNRFKFQPNRFKSTASALAPEDKEDDKTVSHTPHHVADPKPKPWLMDLGVPSLIPEWKRMFNPKTLPSDITAGLTVGCVAVPLSLAIAMASGVPAEVGLATAAVSGIAGGLMGGTTLAVTGPAAAISLLVLGAVNSHGLAALPFITLTVGGLQLASGVTRLGIYAKLVPVSVIAGFTTGVGTLILSAQIPAALGMKAPGGLNPFEMAVWLAGNITGASPASGLLAFGTAGAMYALPKVHPKIPAALLAVGSATAATHLFGMDVALVGTLPSGMEAFQFAMPVLPPLDAVPSLARATLLIYLMTTVESLLSCVALEKMKKTDYKHNPDQELIGQGVSNLGAGMFMGMPVTSVIARSSLNARAGGETRLPALIQSGFVFGSIAFASDKIGMIPMPALSGMLIATGANMLYRREFNYCWSVDKFTTLPFFTTVGGMLSMGLAEGIGIGCATALGLAIKKNMQLRIKMGVHRTKGDFAATGKTVPEAHQEEAVPGKIAVDTTNTGALKLTTTSNVWQVNGPINFMSMFEIDNMVEHIKDRCNTEDPIVVDLRHVTSLDFTGMEELVVRLIEEAEGAPIRMINTREDINSVLNKVDKDSYVERYSSIELID